MSAPVKLAILATILAELMVSAPPGPERDFLVAHEWVPLGKDAATGVEGWGKLIDGEAVILCQAVALAREGWAATA